MGFNQEKCGFNNGNYPLVNVYSLLLNMAIEIVNCPIKKGDFPSYVGLPNGNEISLGELMGFNGIITGWWLTYPSEKWCSERHLGWWHSQYDGKVIFSSHMRFRTGSIQPECQNDASNIWRRYHRYVELGQVNMQEIVNFEQSQQNVEGRFPIQSDMFLLSRI